MPLHIVACIKWVPAATFVEMDEKTGTLRRAGVPSVVNPHDLAALELALELRDRYGGTVTALSMGPPSAEAGLEHAVGMGADRGILVSDKVFAGADTLATSYTLAKAIEKIGRYDLVATGQETTDSSTAHIGAQIAAWLKLPYVYYVVEAEYSEGSRTLRVRRLLEDSCEIYELGLPALISVAMHARNPRRVRLANKLRAKLEDAIKVWGNDVLKLDPARVGLAGSPTRVKRLVAVPEVPRKRERFEGSAEEAAKWLVKKLAEDGLLGV